MAALEVTRPRVKDFADSKSKFIQYALREFKEAGWMDDDFNFSEPDKMELENFGMSMQEAMCVHVLALLDIFAKEEHSGNSAPYAINLFTRLANFKPLTPLEDKEDQWNKVDDSSYQHKRYSAIFKKDNGQAYNVAGIVFYKIDKNGDKSYYTNSDSSIDIAFPYRVPDEPTCMTKEEFKTLRKGE